MATPVHLNNVEAFRAALHEYQMSAHAEKVLRDARLVVMSGLAGGGRNSTIDYLVKNNDYFFIISDTTRPPKIRNGALEQTGVHYYFRTEADMLRDIQQGEFIEAEIIHNQQVSGTSIRELERANKTHRIAIHDYEFGGARNIAQAKSDAFIIGLLPPSYEEWIRRFQGREDIHEQEFINRLQTAEKVLQNMLGEPYFRFVINREIAQCAHDIREIVESGVVDPANQAAAKDVAKAILLEVERKLQSLTRP